MAAPNMIAYQRYNALMMLMAGMKNGELENAAPIGGMAAVMIYQPSDPYGRSRYNPLALRADAVRCIGIDEADGSDHARIVRRNGLLVIPLLVENFPSLGRHIDLLLPSKHNGFVASGLDRGGVLLALLIVHDGERRRSQGEGAGREPASVDGVTISDSAEGDRRLAK